ncbi:MAG: trypsin-like peptidase domain-containing protein [Parcubacteria group bacterium]|nr:trypsin-like peptidase domain-containing protein [Parcubacteria group bacterium]
MFSFFHKLIEKVFTLGAAVALIFFGAPQEIPQPINSGDSFPNYAAVSTVQRNDAAATATETPPVALRQEKTPEPEIAPLPVSDVLEEAASEPAFSPALIDALLARIREPQHSVRINQRELNEYARTAVVNIFCISKAGGLFEPLSGSGVVIDPRGIVLTNAHVAQYFLLKKYRGVENFIDCVIRTGSPARAAYRAELMFLSGNWVRNNAALIGRDNTESSGENDFALLRITGPTTNEAAFPAIFPYLAPAVKTDRDLKNLPVLLASYPAGFLSGLTTNNGLWLISSTALVNNVYTFRETEPYTPDMVGVNGPVGAQEGSSGGAIVSSEDGSLVGLIVTRSDGATTGERELRALTFFHINESIEAETSKTFTQFLQEDPVLTTEIFQRTLAPHYTGLLERALDKK